MILPLFHFGYFFSCRTALNSSMLNRSDESSLSSRKFPVHLRKMCVMLLLTGAFCIFLSDTVDFKNLLQNFPGGTVDKNLPTSAWDTG